MRFAALAFLLLAACYPERPSSPTFAVNNCTPFDYKTVRDGVPVTCRMLWCQAVSSATDAPTGGPATLWCDRDEAPKVSVVEPRPVVTPLP